MRPSRITPAPGQESVWDYPRPPRLERSPKRIRVYFNGHLIADSSRSYRVLETSHPPVYYIPPDDIVEGVLESTPRTTFCEFKGQARYYSVTIGEQKAESSAWYYPTPTAAYEAMAGYVAFYPSRMEACFVDDEQVRAQSGDFYGGWITDDIVGPFKGEPGTRGW